MSEENPENPPLEAESPKQNETESKPRKTLEECVSASPSGEDLPKEETDQIMRSMLELLQDCQKKVDDQKIDSHSLVFMLLRIKESLDAYYNDYIPKLHTFLVQADGLTADYYSYMSRSLPQYGDYVKAIEAEEDDKVEVGASAPLDKKDVIDLVKTVTDNFYNGGMFLKSGRMVYKDINNNQRDRQDIVNKINGPLPNWLEFQDKVTTQLEKIREQTFKISAHVDFLKQGEMKMAPTLDLTPLNQTANSADSSQYFTPDTTKPEKPQPL